ncbi:hypothetical protein [Paraglaciecola sp. L3A3]|uniref:HzsA-related protein n=1 Tax=Paraglaciecola sp. L3A3 TaxID=2686358 RepID=UPI00131AA0F5|nr:hypothetical protein [Paraglaciecola sp. L3A3]
MKIALFSPLFLCCLAALGLSACNSDVSIEPSTQAPDPVVVDIPIAFIKRSLPIDENNQAVEFDLREPSQFVPGAALYIKARASATETEINITDQAFITEDASEAPLYDVKDLEASYDGNRLLFSMRAPEIEGANDDEQPTWNIWEYNRTTDELRRIISSDIVAEAGQDTAPVYLPDGRILFSSTRQRTNQAILLDEGKPQYSGLEESLRRPASVLHVINSDGSEIEQVSFNQSHDLDPLVLQNGKILFSRWDQMGGDKGIHLYQMNPDGSDLEIIYGRHSHNQEGIDQSLHFVQSKETPNNKILLSLLPYQQSRLGTDIVEVDITNYIDIQTPSAASPGINGNAQQSALFDNVQINTEISPGGYFAAVYPLWDGSGRQLFSWSQCRVFDPEQVIEDGSTIARKILPCNDELLALDTIEMAPELYGLWIYNPDENTQSLVSIPTEGMAYTEVVAMESRPSPANAQQAVEFDTELADNNTGALHIRSVYDMAGLDTTPNGLAVMADPAQTSADNRPARFIRIIKGVSIPDDDTLDFDNDAYGRSRNQLMREIVGYATVEPDGSAKFQVPANVPIALSILDKDGKRISQRHQNWLQVTSGEVKTCNGCHQSNNQAPHGRLAAETPSINLGAAVNGLPFPNTNPDLFADAGETMAQTKSRINGLAYPQADIQFSDIWVDSAEQDASADFSYAYQDMQTPLPISASCAQNWHNLCRITINYPVHIQPIFELSRQVFDDMELLLEDHTCISCHSPADMDGMTQIPAAQLDLTITVSTDNADLLTSYRELLFTDNEQELIEGVLIDKLVEVLDGNGDPVYETDEEGELILDANEMPIPVFTTVRVNNTVSTNGARSSSRFFAPFAANASHQNWLSPVELKLLAEWMDIGAQNYNNPFDFPAN